MNNLSTQRGTHVALRILEKTTLGNKHANLGDGFYMGLLYTNRIMVLAPGICNKRTVFHKKSRKEVYKFHLHLFSQLRLSKNYIEDLISRIWAKFAKFTK